MPIRPFCPRKKQKDSGFTAVSHIPIYRMEKLSNMTKPWAPEGPRQHGQIYACAFETFHQCKSGSARKSPQSSKKGAYFFDVFFYFFRGEVGFGLAPIDFSFVFIDFPWFHEALTSVDQIFPGFMGFAKACVNFATGFSSTLRCLSLIFPPIASNCNGFH